MKKKICLIFIAFIFLAGCQGKSKQPSSGINPVSPSDTKISQEAKYAGIPKHVVAHFKQGNFFLMKKQYENAIEKYKLVIQLKPEFVQAHYNLGVAYFETKRNEQAITQWNKTVELDPEYARAYLSLGFAYEKLSNKEKSVENYDKYLQMRPDDPNAKKISERINYLRGAVIGQGIIGRIQLSDKIDTATNQPVSPKDSFSEETRVIYTFADIGDAPPNTVIKASWFYLGLRSEEIPVISKEKIITGPQTMVLELKSPTTRPWPLGRYELRLFVNGKENLSLPFTIIKGNKPDNAPGKST